MEMETKNDFQINKNINKMDFDLDEILIENAQETVKNMTTEEIDEGRKLHEEKKKAQSERYKKWYEKMKEDPERLAEHKRKVKESGKRYYERMMDRGERDEKNLERAKERYRSNKTNEEFMEGRRKTAEKYREKKGRITCECGASIQNIPSRIDHHKKSLDHKMKMIQKDDPDYIKKSMPDEFREYVEKGGGRRTKAEREATMKKYQTPTDSIPCTLCGVNVQFSKIAIERHFTSKQHLKNLLK
jgi:hypothetical protein